MASSSQRRTELIDQIHGRLRGKPLDLAHMSLGSLLNILADLTDTPQRKVKP